MRSRIYVALQLRIVLKEIIVLIHSRSEYCKERSIFIHITKEQTENNRAHSVDD